MSPFIYRLPNELIASISKQLGVEDVFSLATSCRHFLDIIKDENICRHVLQENASSSPEFQAARRSRSRSSFARALRRLAKRKSALASADPYLAAIVAVGDSFLYLEGVLIYVVERTLRILDLQASADTETVIDIRLLLDKAIEESKGKTKYKFQLVHYADGILSCRYTHATSASHHWLLVLHIHKHWVVKQPLESTYKLFVRNNKHYLYYGSHSEVGDDGYRRWVLRRYHFESRQWFPHKIHLQDVVGSDLGGNICFEVIDDYFYGLSNQTSFDVEGVDWTSYYHAFRFPVESPSPQHTQMPVKSALWRRKHAEGPIDDRWTFLRLEKDEASGALQILESRKEWLSGSSSGRRTYYSQLLPDDSHWVGALGTSAGASASTSGSGTSSISEGGSGTASLGAGLDEPQPEEIVNNTRLPEHVHPGDDSSTMLMFTLSKSYIRSYYSPASTYLDLVDDPLPSAPLTQRLRIRAGSRKVRPLHARLQLEESNAAPAPAPVPAEEEDPLYPEQEIKRLYESPEPAFWPRQVQQDPGSSGSSAWRPAQPYLDLLLNPPKHHGNINGTWDDSSLVYSTEGNDKETTKAIIFISFDPSVYLRGLWSWRGGASSLAQDDGNGNGEEKGKGKEKQCPQDLGDSGSGPSSSPPADDAPPGGNPSSKLPTWMRREPAMYRTIDRGIHFAR